VEATALCCACEPDTVVGLEDCVLEGFGREDCDTEECGREEL
jgi:hypothetical protein